MIISKDLKEKIQRKIAAVHEMADDLPGILIIYNIRSNCVEYMSPRGLEELGITLGELKEMGGRYHERFFNPEDSKEYVPRIMELLSASNQKESVTFFQQVRRNEYAEWGWYASNVKLFMRDENGEPVLTVTYTIRIDPDSHINLKVQRLLDENNFHRAKHSNYSKLSDRECFILKLLALGKSSPEIARDLFISVSTVDTHRRNIRQKLNAYTSYELSQYARAFNLI